MTDFERFEGIREALRLGLYTGERKYLDELCAIAHKALEERDELKDRNKTAERDNAEIDAALASPELTNLPLDYDCPTQVDWIKQLGVYVQRLQRRLDAATEIMQDFVDRQRLTVGETEQLRAWLKEPTMNKVLEAMARQQAERVHLVWSRLSSTAKECFEDTAREDWQTGVDALTPDQCSDFANIDDGAMPLTQTVAEVRAALKAVVEVDDGDN